MKLTINKKLLAHYAKGTLSLLKSSNRLYAVNFRSFLILQRVLFHLSLTVLVHYRLLKIL